MLGNMNHPLEMNLPLLTSHFECLKIDELVFVFYGSEWKYPWVLPVFTLEY